MHMEGENRKLRFTAIGLLAGALCLLSPFLASNALAEDCCKCDDSKPFFDPATKMTSLDNWPTLRIGCNSICKTRNVDTLFNDCPDDLLPLPEPKADPEKVPETIILRDYVDLKWETQDMTEKQPVFVPVPIGMMDLRFIPIPHNSPVLPFVSKVLETLDVLLQKVDSWVHSFASETVRILSVLVGENKFWAVALIIGALASAFGLAALGGAVAPKTGGASLVLSAGALKGAGWLIIGICFLAGIQPNRDALLLTSVNIEQVETLGKHSNGLTISGSGPAGTTINVKTEGDWVLVLDGTQCYYIGVDKEEGFPLEGELETPFIAENLFKEKEGPSCKRIRLDS